MEWGSGMKNPKTADSNMNNKRSMFSQALFSQLPEFTFLGNEEVVIEGSKGVLEYSEELIRVNTKIGIVCFFGRRLNLKCISSSELIINGFMTKIEFIF